MSRPVGTVCGMYKTKPSRGHIIPERHLYYIAGIIEGEGWIASQNLTVSVFVKMTDEDTIRRLQSLTGMGKIIGPKKAGKSHWKPYWQWSVCSRGEAARLLLAVYPLLGVRRQKQISDKIKVWEEVK